MIDAAEKRFQTTLHVAYETDCIVVERLIRVFETIES